MNHFVYSKAWNFTWTAFIIMDGFYIYIFIYFIYLFIFLSKKNIFFLPITWLKYSITTAIIIIKYSSICMWGHGKDFIQYSDFVSSYVRWQQDVRMVWHWQSWARQVREWWPSMETQRTLLSQRPSRKPSLIVTSSALLLSRTWYVKTVFRGYFKYCGPNLTNEIVIITLHSPLQVHNLLQIGLICFYSFSSMIIPEFEGCLSLKDHLSLKINLNLIEISPLAAAGGSCHRLRHPWPYRCFCQHIRCFLLQSLWPDPYGSHLPNQRQPGGLPLWGVHW